MKRGIWFGALSAGVLFSGMTACSMGDPEQNKQDGAAFLAENGKKPGILKTSSGLQYQVFTEGKGGRPKAADNVTVNYQGSFIDGKEFDSGESISFPLDGVIPGWTEGLQLMQEGAKYRFFIPPELGYGEAGAARVIPPNATLIFDIELLKVNR